jgi:hypothetical protein
MTKASDWEYRLIVVDGANLRGSVIADSALAGTPGLPGSSTRPQFIDYLRSPEQNGAPYIESNWEVCAVVSDRVETTVLLKRPKP